MVVAVARGVAVVVPIAPREVTRLGSVTLPPTCVALWVVGSAVSATSPILVREEPSVTGFEGRCALNHFVAVLEDAAGGVDGSAKLVAQRGMEVVHLDAFGHFLHVLLERFEVV